MCKQIKSESCSSIHCHNVGNSGDIIKHAALITIARLLNDRNRKKTINYLDTHAFVLAAPCANPGWKAEVLNLAKQYPAYQEYINMETDAVAQGKYKCSPLLILNCLSRPRLYLAEADGDTRHTLKQQLSYMNCEPALLLDDMHDFTSLSDTCQQGPLLALIDPFSETKEEWERTWSASSSAIEALHAPDTDGIVEVFQGGKRGFHSWPAPPNGFIGPVAILDEMPFHLAVYATESMTAGVCSNLMKLGWQTAPPR